MARIPVIVGVTLIFWGWQCDVLMPAVVMALLIEAPLLFQARWDLRDRDFERISDLSAVLLAGLTLFQFDSHGFHAIFPILEASPFVFFPLVLAQRISTRNEISYAALLLSVRRAVRKGRLLSVGKADVGFPFVAVCLLAASAGHRVPEGFFAGLCVIVVWLLLRQRPGGRLAVWVGGVSLAIGLAYVGQLGMVKARAGLEPILMQLFHERMWARRDPYQAHTAIGHIGRLKVSQRIIARVYPQAGKPMPARLHQATYRTYSRQMWFAPRTTFEEIPALGGGSVWELHGADGPSDEAWDIRIASALDKGRGVLMVPSGIERVQGLNVDQLSRNEMGTIKVNTGPDVIDFNVRFAASSRHVEAPAPADLSVPRTHFELFEELAEQLGTKGLPAAEVIARARAFFDDGFSYSLTGRKRWRFMTTPLEDFVKRTKAGHCEYFATATVLLLRASGVPARYATGYAVNEWSALEEAFVVRRRHAHSWASAFVDGEWVEIDTTPAVWMVNESADSPWWIGTYDLLAWLRHRFDQWRYDDSDWVESETLIGAALILTAILAWRLARTTKVVRRKEGDDTPKEWPGLDSELYALEAWLTERLGVRGPAETWAAWLSRGEREGMLPEADWLKNEVIPRHYRYRFDPDGLPGNEREAMREAISAWRSRNEAPLTSE